LKVNPQGSVPVAKDLRPTVDASNPWVVDSGTICDWLESSFASPPSVGTVEEASSAPGGDLFPAFAGFIKAAVGSPEEGEKREKLDEAVLSLAKAIEASGKPFLCGDAPKQADFALAPKLHHLSIAAPAHKGWSFPDGSKAVTDYLGRMRARPSWKAHEYSDECVVAGWKKNVGVDAKK
jgi:glutathione S-transferase